MQLNCEMTLIVGAFVMTLARAAQKRCKGLAWKSDRGLRTWQMYNGVSWEPGRAEHLLAKIRRIGITGLLKPWCCRERFPYLQQAGRDTKGREAGGGITYRQREEVRRMFGSLSTLILPFESRETHPRKPVSREGECR